MEPAELTESIESIELKEEPKKELFVGDLVGLFVGDLVGLFVGDFVGPFVGDFVGASVALLHTPQDSLQSPTVSRSHKF
jgi:gas vesicle protein